MTTHVMSDDASNLTSSKYFDGTDASTAMQSDGMFDNGGYLDADDTLPDPEDGAMGAIGPVKGAQHMPNAAQPGSMG